MSQQTPKQEAPAEFEGLSVSPIYNEAGEVFKHYDLKINTKKGNFTIQYGGKKASLSYAESLDEAKVGQVARELGVPSSQLYLALMEEINRKEDEQAFITKFIETGKPYEQIVFQDFENILINEVFDYEEKKFLFCIYDKMNNKWELKSEYETDGKVFIPRRIPVNEKGLPRVILPSLPLEYQSVEKLREEVKSFIAKGVELDEDALWIVVNFVLHSWIFDISDYAMQLFVRGLLGSGKTRLYKILKLLCYNSLGLNGGSSVSAYRRLEEKFRGTLLINEFEPKGTEDSDEVILWLNSGFERDLPIALSNKKDPSKQEFFEPFCPKLLTSRSNIDNPATRSRLTVIEILEKTREDIPIGIPSELYEEAKQLRGKLLLFRLRHYSKNYVLPSELEKKLQSDKRLDNRFKQDAYPLLVLYSISGLDTEEVFKFYEKQQMKFKRDIALNTVEGIVFNTLLELSSRIDFDSSFYGWVSEDRKLIGIGVKLLQAHTGFSYGTIVKALTKIGLVPERTTAQVLVWDEADNQPKTKWKTLRLWKFPNEKVWKRAVGLYYYKEDEGVPTGVISVMSVMNCPTPLRASTFMTPMTPMTLPDTANKEASLNQFTNESEIYKQDNEIKSIQTNDSLGEFVNNLGREGEAISSLGVSVGRSSTDSSPSPNLNFRSGENGTIDPVACLWLFHEENPDRKDVYLCRDCFNELHSEGLIWGVWNETWVTGCELCNSPQVVSEAFLKLNSGSNEKEG